MPELENTLLGQEVSYDHAYDPALLDPISRETARSGLMMPSGYQGHDLWTSYEFSCLHLSGLPLVAVAYFEIPSDSRCIIESKSFKLYLNSYNHEKFSSLKEAEGRIKADLSDAAGADVKVELRSLSQTTDETDFDTRIYHCVDDTEFSDQPFVYEPDSSILTLDQSVEGEALVEEHLYSDLLRSNCPVTGQPDWGSVFVYYRGKKISHESLLRYIVSFRTCQEFHEHCVEKMFSEILERCECEALYVYARYTRRGGLDINPYRSTENLSAIAPDFRTIRQ